jgi:HEAT repeat protein
VSHPWDWLHDLAGDNEAAAVRAWHEMARQGSLAAACRTAPRSQLEQAWAAVRQAEPFLEYFFQTDRAFAGYEVGHERIAGALAGLIASALVARAAQEADLSHVASWAAQVVVAWRGLGPAPPESSDWLKGHLIGPAPDDWFLALHRQVSACWPVGAARDCVAEFLGHPRHVLRRRLAPLLGYRDDGFVGELCVELVAEGTGEFYSDPLRMGLIPMARDFLCAVDAAWAAATRLAGPPPVGTDVRWSMAATDLTLLAGGSLGAALAVVLTGLVRDDPLPRDDRCALTATVDLEGRLGPVQAVVAKVRAAFGQGPGVTRVLVHPANQDEARLAAHKAGWRDPDTDVQVATTLEEACERSLGLAARLRDYCELLLWQSHQEGLTPAYLDGRTPVALFVPPDVLKVEADVGAGADGPRTGPLAAEPWDVVEDSLYGDNLGEAEERVAWQEEWERQARRAGPWRAVVLGPPGQGKSFLVETTARELAQRLRDQLPQPDLMLARVSLVVAVSLDRLTTTSIERGETPEGALRAALAAALREKGCSEVAAGYLAMHAHEERSWLFLDALDEVPDDPKRRATLAAYFAVLRDWRCRLVLTSRPAEYRERRPGFALTEYRLAPLSPHQVQAFVDQWFAGGTAPAALTALVRQSGPVQQLTRNPFLLTLLCAVAEQDNLPNDLTRARLYDRALRLALGGAVRVAEWLPLLRELAWQAFNRASHQPRIAAEELVQVLRDYRQRPPVPGAGAGLSEMEKAALLREELCRDRLLVPLPAQDGFVFPHRSFPEYLAAAFLAERIGDRDWSTVLVQVPGAIGLENVRDLVDRKAWLPAWEEIVLFLAGQLREPAPLLELLADGSRDDLFRHRLGLAGRCLAEIAQPPAALANRITTEAFSAWWEQAQGGTAIAVVDHLGRALPALARSGGRVQGVRLLEWLRWDLDEPRTRPAALVAVKHLGDTAAEPAIVDRVIGLLGDPDPKVKILAAEAVGRLGAAAARPDAVNWLLAHFLQPHDDDLQRAAAESLKQLGLAAQAYLASRVGDLLRDEDERVRRGALRGVGRLGTAAVGLIDQVIALLHAEPQDGGVRRAGPSAGGMETFVRGSGGVGRPAPSESAGVGRPAPSAVPSAEERWEAVRALAGLGKAAARPEVLDRLADLLGDPDWQIRERSADTLEAVGSAAANPALIDRLARLLNHLDWEMREAAGRVVWVLCSTVTDSGVLERLLGLLRGQDPELAELVVWKLTGLGGAAARASHLDQLAELLAEPQRIGEGGWWRFRAVVEAIRFFGSAAARDDILEGLAHALERGGWETANRIALAVYDLGSAAAKPAFLDRLAELLAHPHWESRLAACQTAAAIGPAAAARDDLLDRLAQILHHDRAEVEAAALLTLNSFGSAATTAPFLDRVAGLLDTQQRPPNRMHSVCQAGLMALAVLGGVAARDDLLDRIALLLDDRDPRTRQLAATAVANLGQAAARADILQRLGRLFRDDDADGLVRQAAAVAVRRLMGEGLRFFAPAGDAAWAVKTVAELSS